MIKRILFVAAGLVLACAAVSVQAPPGAPAASPAPARGGGRGPAPAPRIISFEARPASIKPGESVLLVWSVENPGGPVIEPAIGPVIPRGSRQVKPAATTTYTLTMRGPNETVVTKSVTVTVAGTTPVAATPAAPTAASKGIPRTPDGKPDFSGV